MSENILQATTLEKLENITDQPVHTSVEEFVAAADPKQIDHTYEYSPYNFLAGFLAVNEQSVAHISLVNSSEYQQASISSLELLGFDLEEFRASMRAKMANSNLDNFSGDLDLFGIDDIVKLHLTHEVITVIRQQHKQQRFGGELAIAA